MTSPGAAGAFSRDAVSAGRARAAAVVPAGGGGRRMGGVRKQYLELAGDPVLAHALRPLLAHEAVEWVVVALPAEDAADPPAWLLELDPRIRVVAGGEERGDSVRLGLEAVPAEADVVLIHDAARPLVTVDIVTRCVEAAARGVGAVAAVPAADTIKDVDDDRIVGTPDRARLWLAQTPQAFPRAVVLDAYRRAAAEGFRGTDDAALVERYGGTVLVVEGARENFKVTSRSDLVLAEAVLAARAEERLGTGARHG